MGILKINQPENRAEGLSRRALIMGSVAATISGIAWIQTGALAEELKPLKASVTTSTFGIDYEALIKQDLGVEDPELAKVLISIEQEFLGYDPNTKQGSFEKLMAELIPQLKDGNISPKLQGTLTRRSPLAYAELGKLFLDRGNQAETDAKKLEKIANSL